MVEKKPPYLRLVIGGEVRQEEDDLTFTIKLGGSEIRLRFDPEKLARMAADEAKIVGFPRPKPKPLTLEIIREICEESGVLLPGAENWIYKSYMSRWNDWGHPDDLAREIRRKPPPLFPLEKGKFGIRNKKTVIGWGFLNLLNEEGLKDPVEASKNIAHRIFRDQYGDK